MPKYLLEVPGKSVGVEFNGSAGIHDRASGQLITEPIYAAYHSLLWMGEIPEGFCPLSQVVKITPLSEEDKT